MKSHWRLSVILLSLSGVLNSVAVAANAAWPFDQRQIALIRKEGSDFVDERTAAQLMDAFVKFGRVKWVTQKAGPTQIVPFEVPPDFPWQSAPSVRMLGLRYRADGILTLVKKGVLVTLEWYGTVDGQPLFFESMSLPDATTPEDIEARKKRIVGWVEEIWAKIPGVGYSVKRDLSTVTVEGVAQVGLELGDELEFRRLEKMERHPLLKTLIGISSSITGRGTVTAIDKNLATVKVDYESQVDPIQTGDRYAITAKKSAKIEKKLEVEKTVTVDPSKIEKQTDAEGRSFLPLFSPDNGKGPGVDPNSSNVPKYKILDLTGFLGFGKVKHVETTAATVTLPSASHSLSALAPTFGVRMLGYITREVILLSDIDFSLVNFRSPPADYNISSLSSGLTSFRLGSGYRFLFSNGAPTDGEIVLSVGYRRFAMSLSQAPVTFAPTAKTYSGFDLGLMLLIPIDTTTKIHFGGSRIFSATLGEAPAASGGKGSSQIWNFEAGGRYQLNPSNEVYASFVFNSATTTFKTTGARTVASISSSLQSTVLNLGYTVKF